MSKKNFSTIIKIIIVSVISAVGAAFVFLLLLSLEMFIAFLIITRIDIWKMRFDNHIKWNDPCFHAYEVSKGKAHSIKKGRVCMEFKRGARYAYTKTLDGADAKTFHEINAFYFADKNNVYYGDKRLPGAKPSDFREIGKHSGYYRSGNNFYYKDKRLSADAKTFEIVKDNQGHSRGYAKDKNTVWKWGVKLSGVEAISFSLLKSEYYTKDKNHVYFNDKIFAIADPKTFVVLNDINGAYAKDKKMAYYYGKVITEADPLTFFALRRWYALDKNHVYYGEKMLKNLDSLSLRQIGTSSYLRDDDSLYYADREVSGVDLDSFHSVAYHKKGKNGVNFLSDMSSCGTDDRVVVCNDEKISGGKIVKSEKSFGYMNNIDFQIPKIKKMIFDKQNIR